MSGEECEDVPVAGRAQFRYTYWKTNKQKWWGRYKRVNLELATCYYSTAEAAARAVDRYIYKLEGPDGHTNFPLTAEQQSELDGLTLVQVEAQFRTEGTKFSDGTSEFRGVSFNKHSGKHRAQIQFNGTRVNMDRTDTEQLAAEQYDAAAWVVHGRRARLNFPSAFLDEHGQAREHVPQLPAHLLAKVKAALTGAKPKKVARPPPPRRILAHTGASAVPLPAATMPQGLQHVSAAAQPLPEAVEQAEAAGDLSMCSDGAESADEAATHRAGLGDDASVLAGDDSSRQAAPDEEEVRGGTVDHQLSAEKDGQQATAAAHPGLMPSAVGAGRQGDGQHMAHASSPACSSCCGRPIPKCSEDAVADPLLDSEPELDSYLLDSSPSGCKAAPEAELDADLGVTDAPHATGQPGPAACLVSSRPHPGIDSSCRAPAPQCAPNPASSRAHAAGVLQVGPGPEQQHGCIGHSEARPCPASQPTQPAPEHSSGTPGTAGPAALAGPAAVARAQLQTEAGGPAGWTPGLAAELGDRELGGRENQPLAACSPPVRAAAQLPRAQAQQLLEQCRLPLAVWPDLDGLTTYALATQLPVGEPAEPAPGSAGPEGRVPAAAEPVAEEARAYERLLASLLPPPELEGGADKSAGRPTDRNSPGVQPSPAIPPLATHQAAAQSADRLAQLALAVAAAEEDHAVWLADLAAAAAPGAPNDHPVYLLPCWRRRDHPPAAAQRAAPGAHDPAGVLAAAGGARDAGAAAGGLGSSAGLARAAASTPTAIGSQPGEAAGGLPPPPAPVVARRMTEEAFNLEACAHIDTAAVEQLMWLYYQWALQQRLADTVPGFLEWGGWRRVASDTYQSSSQALQQAGQRLTQQAAARDLRFNERRPGFDPLLRSCFWRSYFSYFIVEAEELLDRLTAAQGVAGAAVRAAGGASSSGARPGEAAASSQMSRGGKHGRRGRA